MSTVKPYYHTYSTDEHIVGLWIDNSIIYEKTFTGGSSSSNVSIDVTALNIDKFLGVDTGASMVVRADNSTYNSINYNLPTDMRYANGVYFTSDGTTDSVVIQRNKYNIKSYILTIWYTKSSS